MRFANVRHIVWNFEIIIFEDYGGTIAPTDGATNSTT